jgi:BRCT domain type II-containing protein
MQSDKNLPTFQICLRPPLHAATSHKTEPTSHSLPSRSEISQNLFQIALNIQNLYNLFIKNRSRVSSGSIVSDYGLDDRAIGVRSPAGAKEWQPEWHWLLYEI